MRDKDAKILMERYSFIREEQQASANKDQVGQQVAGKFNELLPSWQKTADQFKAEYSALKTPEEQEKFFKEKVLPVINNATKQSSQQGQGQQQAPQQQLNQSYEYIENVINEGWFDRLKSSASGAYGALTGPKPGDTSGKATDYQSGKINKRFEILQNTIGKQLKELQRDLGTTKNSDPETKKRVDDLITSLDSKAGIKPVETTLGNVAHAAGRVQEFIGKGILAAPFVMVSGAIASLTGATGMAYGAIKGGIAASSIYAIKTLLDGKQPTAKGTALAAAAGAAIGAATMGIIDNFDKIKQAFSSLGDLNPFGNNGMHSIPDSQFQALDNQYANDLTGSDGKFHFDPNQAFKSGSTLSDHDLMQDIINHFKGGTTTPLGQMGHTGAPTSLSRIDNDMAENVFNAVKKQGLDWSQMTDKAKNALIDKITGAHGRG